MEEDAKLLLWRNKNSQFALIAIYYRRSLVYSFCIESVILDMTHSKDYGWEIDISE